MWKPRISDSQDLNRNLIFLALAVTFELGVN